MARNDYTLVVFDENGNEQHDQHGDLGSAKAANRMRQEGSTDIFLMSHGWQGDVPGAVDQYNRWSDAMLANPDDLTRLGTLRPGFKPLLIGVHWPSLPWGDENPVASFAINTAAAVFDPIADYAKRLGDTPEILAAVQRVFDATAAATDSKSMSPQLEQAYLDLDKAVGLGASGVGGSPSDDRLPFDPKAVFTAARNPQGPAASFAGFNFGALLAPLRVLSFWKMKDRARSIGEGAGFNLLHTLQQAAGANVRFHLMGHSFGCIVVSAIAAGPRPIAPAPQVQSLVLVEGAFSLWAYAAQIPPAPGVTGYFNPVVSAKRISGPIVAVRSAFDRAVGFFYPLAAAPAQQVSFDMPQFPLYGAVGMFGVQGVAHTELASMLPITSQYDFQPGQVYNIESSNIIKRLVDPIAGAHNDISHPEVGHVIWQAVLAPDA